MPRKYDRVIRYYDSWFADLSDPSKELSAEECWKVMLAVRECQLSASLEPLEQLPLSIRRALSMATMGEQIIRLLERAENMRKRGSAGGRATAARERTPEEIAAAKMKAEREAKEQEEQQRKYDYIGCGKEGLAEYQRLKAAAAAGDIEAKRKLHLI